MQYLASVLKCPIVFVTQEIALERKFHVLGPRDLDNVSYLGYCTKCRHQVELGFKGCPVCHSSYCWECLRAVLPKETQENEQEDTLALCYVCPECEEAPLPIWALELLDSSLAKW